MSPTIQPGDRMWIDHVTYGARLPHRWADIPIINVFTWNSCFRKADECNDWGVHRMMGFRLPKIGDMVVFDSPEYPYLQLVKRISLILNAGELITVTYENYKNMSRIVKSENHTIYRRQGKIVIDGVIDSTCVLSQPYYFMCGDNTENSNDSRAFGYIPYSSIVGRVNFVFYSLDSEQTWLKKIRINRIMKFIK